MLNKKLIAEIKELFEDFKLTEQYDNRKLQAAFIPFGKELIEKLLQKAEITNLDLTGLIQILKANSNNMMAHRYIPQMFTNEAVAESLLNKFAGLDYKGYTGAGKSGIAKPNDNELGDIKNFLNGAFTVKSVDQAVALCDEYDNLNIPEVKKGVYSPWLFYINPTLFPIVNTKHLQFLDWVGVSHKYSDSINLYNELETVLETDMGLLDAFIYFREFEGTIEHNNSALPLNTILYGPSGTGKTFATIDKAVAIANPVFDVRNARREDLKQEYQRLVDEKQIEFITFHQSLSYEDFIEGIKPVLLNAENEELPDTGPLRYKIEPGIFYRICKQAKYKPGVQIARFHITSDNFDRASFFKISLGNTQISEDNDIYEYCIKNSCIALGWGGDTDFSSLDESATRKKAQERETGAAVIFINCFIHKLKKGNYIIVSKGNFTCRAIGKVTSDYFYKETGEIEYNQFRSVQWLMTDVDIPVSALYGKVFSQQSIYRLKKDQIKKEFFVKSAKEIKNEAPAEPKEYVLIIDEINRGNVSQIFGELITLIEDDKREGRPEALEVILPYSKESFSVPPNLHIIGTMNTADRSVEALDTALRRRFSFIEMLPQEDHQDINDVEDVNLQYVLKSINIRLEKLLSRDHMIGHSFLMNLENVEELHCAFYNKIIPQLQEYFFGDYGKIGLVLGKSFVETITIQTTFADFEYEDKDILMERKVYRINNFKIEDDEIDEDGFLNAVRAIVG